MFWCIFVIFENANMIPLINGRPRSFCPRRATVAMGDHVSKRLKLIAAPEAEMEERSFPNPYPDWEPEDPSPEAENNPNEPLDAEGKVASPAFQEPFEFMKRAKLALA